MILQSLHDYYVRKMSDPDPAHRLPAPGLEEKEIPFILELAEDGRLAAIKDTRRIDGKKKIATRYRVPQGVKKTSAVAANLLWDNAEYVLGVPDAKKLADASAKGKKDEYLARLRDMRAAFKARILELPAVSEQDDGLRAVVAFLEKDQTDVLALQPAWSEIAETNPVLSFRMASENDLVCQRPAVAVAAMVTTEPVEVGSGATSGPPGDICLVTGERGPAERLHTAIKGVWNAQSSGANIVSFNLDAFNSHGKEQGGNAPVGAAAAFGYTTALNHLLERGSRQRIQVGDASTVFWSQRADDAPMEDWFVDAFGEAGATDDADARTERVRNLLESIHSGRFDGGDGDHRFFVLGLAPNAARIAIRFWWAAPLKDLALRMREWFEDLRIVRGPVDPEYPTLFRLLTAAAVQGKSENIPPRLGGDVMRSVLSGRPLPATWLQATVQRCCADQARKSDTGKPVPNVSYHRAAVLKACLNRLQRHGQLHAKEIDVALDDTNADPAYLLGRLFAAYERIQADAAGRDLNRTIRDTYFSSAMGNPATVFPRLVQLNQHHMRDLGRSKLGLQVLRDRLLGGIWGLLPADFEFPSNQPLAERARFALGYYHQRQDFFTSKSESAPIPQTA